jgi:hypothetical protein
MTRTTQQEEDTLLTGKTAWYFVLLHIQAAPKGEDLQTPHK